MKNKRNNGRAMIPLIIMIVGIIILCFGIYNFYYASSHTWGDPGSSSDRYHKAPYKEKGTTFCVAGGICIFLGFVFYIGKSRKNDNNINTINKTNSIDEIKKLKDLLDTGAITQEEFEKQKKKILNE